MGLKIVGTGFGRTGTKSLKAALEFLGFGPCYHMSELHDNPAHLVYWREAMVSGETAWESLFEGYDSCVDWPATYYWRSLVEFYPDAKVLLSVRDAEAWVKSIQATIFPALRSVSNMPPGEQRDRREMTYEIIARRTFDERLDDHDHLISVFQRHAEDVQSIVSKDRLLTYDVAEGWGPLCGFLGVEVPEDPFPFTNTTVEFQERARERDRTAREAAGN